MTFTNAKILIKDRTTGKFLVGMRLDSLIPYSVLGGKKESDDKTPLDTINRELQEESSNVLKLLNRNDKLYLVDIDANKGYPLQLIKKNEKNKQVYYLMELESSMDIKKIDEWNERMQNNQTEIINQTLKSLKKAIPEVTSTQILEWILKFKNNYQSPVLKLILTNLGFDSRSIKKIIDFLENQNYYLENDRLAFVTVNDLINGLYEKDLILDKDLIDFFRQTKY
jgi:hypothetical protein